MKVCRFCTNYKPDVRYRGVIGWCKIKDAPQQVKDSCMHFEEGKQEWMQGGPVEE